MPGDRTAGLRGMLDDAVGVEDGDRYLAAV
jgi:hypothetical protein